MRKLKGEPKLSIVIPTYNEKENIRRLVPRIFKSMEPLGVKTEVIIVDDSSPDRTAEEAIRLAKKYLVHVIVRPGKQGLSSAVLEGFRNSNADIVGVMDADLSHPPEKLPEMYAEMESSDMVMGSRHVRGASIEGWPLKRKIISRGAKLLARPITAVKDPLSGFFLVKKSLIDKAELNPKGFKIALEIIGKTGPMVAEVPIRFRDREYGKSKMGKGEIRNYLSHVLALYKTRIRRSAG